MSTSGSARDYSAWKNASTCSITAKVKLRGQYTNLKNWPYHDSLQLELGDSEIIPVSVGGLRRRSHLRVSCVSSSVQISSCNRWSIDPLRQLSFLGRAPTQPIVGRGPPNSLTVKEL